MKIDIKALRELHAKATQWDARIISADKAFDIFPALLDRIEELEAENARLDAGWHKANQDALEAALTPKEPT